MATAEQSLVRWFQEPLGREAREKLAAVPGWCDLLAVHLRAARVTWPTIRLPSRIFLPYLANRIPFGPSLERALHNWCVDDLYLCCACASGDQQAIALFSQRYDPVVLATLRGLRLSAVLVEDARQHIMAQLLVGGKKQAPMIENYRGSGKLSRWLRVVTARAARKMLHREKKLIPVGDAHLADNLELGSSDPELQRIKQIYRKEFKEAFKRVLSELPSREANLLRYRYGDGLNLQQIGAIYRVHHTTVLRQLERVKKALLARTYALLQEQLNVTQNECASVIRLIQSNFGFTLQTFFARLDEAGTDSRT